MDSRTLLCMMDADVELILWARKGDIESAINKWKLLLVLV